MAIATLTDLELRYTAETVRQWADDDRDGAADAAVVAAALDKATNRVETVLKQAYPAAVPFDAANVPGAVKEIALSIAGYRLAGRRGKAAELYQTEFEQAEKELAALLLPNACLVYPDGATVYAEGSAEAAADGGIWSSTADRTPVFSDDALAKF